MKGFNKWLGGVGALLLCGSVSYGGILTADNTSNLNVTSVPGPGALGYVYYNTNDTLGNWTYSGPSQVTPVPFVSIEPEPNTNWAAGPGWTTLAIAGVTPSPTQTGLLYIGQDMPADRTILTVTLTDTNGSTTDGAAVQSFRLGLLTNSGTSGANDNYSTFDVTSSLGDSVEITPQVVSSPENDFYYVDVSGGHAGDVITITGNLLANNNNSCLGGLTFDTLAVPEPASLGLLAIGIPMLLRRQARGH